MLKDFSSEFTLKDPTVINLNNGTLGLCPDVVIAAQVRELKEFEANPAESFRVCWERLWKVQNRLAAFFQTQAENLFLRPNVTLALNELILGLSLPPGSEILTTNFEYGAVLNIIKTKCQRENLGLRILDFSFIQNETFDATRIVQYIQQALKPQTKLVVLSHIFTGNGLRLPIAEIGKALRERDVFLILDGAHGPGCLDLDLSDVDMYAGNLHKWIMGPKGTAFACVHPRHQAQISPLYSSWTYFDEVPESMKTFSTPGSFASRMLWSHSQSFASYYALEACLDFWSGYGFKNILKEIQKRARFLEEGLQDLGLKPLVSSFSEFGSPLLAYELSKFRSDLITGNFIKSDSTLRPLQVGLPRIPSPKVLRLTAHLHNSEAELDEALKTLQEALV